jgi:hypothetical protein
MSSFSIRPAVLAAGVLATVVAAPLFAATQGEIGGIPYVNGGVTSDEADTLRAEARRFPMEVTMARRSEFPGYNEFVAAARLRVLDSRGNVLFERADTGPIFLADLPPGDYTLEATYDGQTRTQHVHVGGQKHANVTFVWPSGQ